MPAKLGIIGCGKMGYALLKGITRGNGDYETIYVCDPDSERSQLFAQEFGAIRASKQELIGKSDIIILAVKPAQVKTVLAETQAVWDADKLLISIAAGIKTVTLEKELGQKVPVVRVMPNTPCLVGEGVSAISGGSLATGKDLQLVQTMLEKLGLAVIVDEIHMDAITAVSGSGPAYAFLVVEAMTDAALSAGLSTDMARRLVIQTFKGSLAMLEKTGEHPAVLKAQVTSPGGTAIAGLRELEAGGIREAFFAAIERARQRSMELGTE